MGGKTIQIFLPDGNPKGVKKASVTTDKIEIIQVPRSNLNENRKYLDFNGVYILVDSLKAEKPEIYIGKGNIKDRASSHDSKKEFWYILFAVRLKDDTGFNDAHNSYMEYYFINKATEINQSIMNENKQTPKKPNLSEEVLSELEHYCNVIEILLSTLGLKCFQNIENTNITDKDIFYCSDKYGSYGKGEYTEEGFLLYKGSKCKKVLHKGTKYVSKRDSLIQNNVLKLENDFFVLQENTLLSVSTAAAITLGRRANGWREWKNKDNKTLDEIERK